MIMVPTNHAISLSGLNERIKQYEKNIKRKEYSAHPHYWKLLPAFYFIPKEYLMDRYELLLDIPRNPMDVYTNAKGSALVDTFLFAECVTNYYTETIWKILSPNKRMSSYSMDDPLYLLLHCYCYWLENFTYYGYIMHPERMVVNILKVCDFEFNTTREAQVILEMFVDEIIKKDQLDEVFSVCKKHRCFEDFNEKISKERIDFYRKWYHTKTQYEQVSLNKEQYFLQDSNLENSIVAKLTIEEFWESLDNIDKKILEMRLEEYTYQEIADKLEFKTHSAVLKRMNKIKANFEKFVGVSL